MMNREIKRRRKRLFVLLLITALLWNGGSPIRMYAANYSNNVSDAADISENQILSAGDTIEIDAMTQSATGQTFMISYYDWGDNGKELNIIEVASGEVHTVEEYTGGSLNTGSFGGWKVKSVYSSGGYIASLVLQAVKQYGITYELDGGMNADANPSAYVEGVGVERLADASKTGYTFDGWYSDADYRNQVKTISDTEASDITLYAKFTPNVYKVTYELDGGTNAAQNPEIYTYGVGISALADAAKIGYTFEGWYTDKGEGVQITQISTTQTGDITLYARFTANTYKITYELDGGTNAGSNPNGYTYGNGIPSFEDAKKTGYTFDGWYSDAKFTTKVTSVSDTNTGDITLYAKYSVNTYKITYVLDGGTNAASNPDSYTYGTGVTLENATKPGYTFEGWYSDPEYKVKIENISKTQAEDMTLYAHFTENIYKITYELDGGTNAAQNPGSYTYGKGVADFADAEKPGYTFEGWYLDINFKTQVTSIRATETGNITLYARFTPNQYTITYVLDGGTNGSGNPTDYTYGVGVPELEEAVKLGYTFEGWYLDADFTKKVTSIGKEESEKVTLYAHFTADIYRITYELDGGTNESSNPEQYTYGIGVEGFGDAKKTGYTFEGWYTDADYSVRVEGIDKTQMGEITLYAKFTANTYKITYELNGGTNAEANPTVYTYGIGIAQLKEATKTGYTFEGWYTDADYSIRVDSISKTQTEEITLYAKFTANTYKITYVPDDGTNAESNPTVYTYGIGIAQLKEALKTGYTFEGWYTDAKFTSRVTSVSDTNTGDLTLYAKYSVNTYKITYELDGGTNGSGNSESYTYGIGVEGFADASKTGYLFEGWYADAAGSIKVESISTTQTGDVILYAKFTQDMGNLEPDTPEPNPPEEEPSAPDTPEINPPEEEPSAPDTPEINPPTEENPSEEPTVITEGGTVRLKSGIAYELGAGTWKVTGDDTVYTGGIIFYVSEDSEYEFIKQ